MTVKLHVDVEVSEEDRDYISGALSERGQRWEDFVREALLNWAAF